MNKDKEAIMQCFIDLCQDQDRNRRIDSYANQHQKHIYEVASSVEKVIIRVDEKNMQLHYYFKNVVEHFDLSYGEIMILKKAFFSHLKN